MRIWARWLVIAYAGVAATAIPGPTLVHAHHPWMVRRAAPELEARWTALRQKYPPEEGNASARELQALAQRLGLDLAAYRPNSDSPPPSPRPSGVDPLRQPAWKDLGSYLRSALDTPGDGIPEAPAAVSDYLRAHRADLDRLIAHLADGPAPRWPAEVDKPDGPALHGARVLAPRTLLGAEVLWQERQGAHSAAQRALQAHWRLGRAFARRPDSIARIVSEGYATTALRLLHKLEHVPSTWQQRLGEFDPHGDQEEKADLTTLEMMEAWRAEKNDSWALDAAQHDHAIALRRTVADYPATRPARWMPGL